MLYEMMQSRVLPTFYRFVQCTVFYRHRKSIASIVIRHFSFAVFSLTEVCLASFKYCSLVVTQAEWFEIRLFESCTHVYRLLILSQFVNLYLYPSCTIVMFSSRSSLRHRNTERRNSAELHLVYD